jgi:peptide/nickel transport system substrate-binding protein
MIRALRPVFPVFTALLLGGCGPHATDRHANVFRYNQAEGVTSLDPAQARNLENIWACDQLFDGLVEMDADLVVRPSIARDWTVEENGQRYTFHLRSDVRFHPCPCFPGGEGRRVVSEDVRYSLERLRDPRTASPGRWILEHVMPGEQGIAAPDDSTLVVRLQRSFPPFLGMLTMVYASVVPREAVDHHGADFRRRPVGAGPFRFFHWEEGVKLVLHRNDRYHQRDAQGAPLPYLDGVVVSFVRDRNAEYLSLLKGELDMMSGADGAFLSDLLDPLGRVKERHTGRVRVERVPALATDYLGFHLEDNGPWAADPRLRQSLNFALDRQRLVTHLFKGIGSPARGMLPPGLPGASAAGFHHDPAKARQLLADAGFPAGKGLPPLTMTVTASYLELCELVQHDLAAFGIDVRIEVVPLSTHKEGTANGEFPFFRKNWIADYPDAENFLMLFASANRAPAGPNYTRFADPRYDAWYTAALATVDDSARIALYQRMDSMLIAQAPAVFLFHPDVVRFISPGVEGLRADPMNQLDLRRVRKTAARAEPAGSAAHGQ